MYLTRPSPDCLERLGHLERPSGGRGTLVGGSGEDLHRVPSSRALVHISEAGLGWKSFTDDRLLEVETSCAAGCDVGPPQQSSTAVIKNDKVDEWSTGMSCSGTDDACLDLLFGQRNSSQTCASFPGWRRSPGRACAICNLVCGVNVREGESVWMLRRRPRPCGPYT